MKTCLLVDTYFSKPNPHAMDSFPVCFSLSLFVSLPGNVMLHRCLVIGNEGMTNSERLSEKNQTMFTLVGRLHIAR
jgi:hypothetical protein